MRSRPRFFVIMASCMFVAGLAVGVVSGEEKPTPEVGASGPPGANASKDAEHPGTPGAVASEGDAFSKIHDSAADAEDYEGACLSNPMVLTEIREQKEAITKARKDLAAREAELKARELAMAEELKKLQVLRDDVNKTDVVRKKENQEKLTKMIETLESMSPKAAAKMLAELDDTLTITAMQKMDTAKLAKIMNLLDSKRASYLSELLTGVARSRTVAPGERVNARPAPVQVASADGSNVTNQKIEKGGNKDDGQNHDSSGGSAERKPGSVATQPVSGRESGLGKAKH